MQQVEIKKPGSYLRTKGNNVPERQGRKFQPKSQTLDFLMEILSRGLEAAGKGASEIHEEPGKIKRSGRGTPQLPSAEFDQLAKREIVDRPSNLRSIPPDLSGPIKATGFGDQEVETVPLDDVPPIESFFSGKNNNLKDFINNATDDNAGLSSALLANQEENSSVEFNPPPAGETQVGTEDPEGRISGLENPEQGRPVKILSFMGSLVKREGLNLPWDDNLLINTGPKVVEKISRSLTSATSRSMADPKEEKVGSNNPFEQAYLSGDFHGKGLRLGDSKVQTDLGRQSPHSFMIEKGEGKPFEEGKGRQPDLSLFIKEDSLGEPKDLSAATDRDGLEMTFDFDRLNNKDYFHHGEALQGKGPSQTPNSPFNLTDYVLQDSTGSVKLINDKPNPISHFPKSFEPDVLKDYYVTVKKQTSSTMEISLEPAGLGKLDIELNLNQDRLQGQIMVHDNAGKELIEQNLPQLLADLAREGLQIGGFTVSLKNQGRGQNPIQILNEFEEPPLMPVSPEQTVPIQGNHLIHIII
jgi:hypothetical protein